MRRLCLLLGLALVAACSIGQFGPWLDESGQPLEGSQVIQYRGFEICGHDEVTFLFFFGDLYAQDDDGALGQLTNAEGEVLTFEVLNELPPGTEATHITLGTKEIFFDPNTREDYLYIYRSDDQRAERWPRAEIECDRPGTPG
ncbi:MAG: hypothetical protein WD354_00700 [Acidimicrobiia bacterium]